MKSFTFFIIFSGFFVNSLHAQNLIIQDSLRTAEIQWNAEQNKVVFSSSTPALHQIAGAPEAFYTYFWEFGDGHYSFDEQPTHVYEKPGDYTVRLMATNNYDDGKPPTSRPKLASVTEISNQNIASDENSALISEHDAFRLLKNREPVPNETVAFVISYANDKTYPTDGRIYLFYNDKKFDKDNFNLSETRTYYGEYSATDTFKNLAQIHLTKEDFILTTGWKADEYWLKETNDSVLKYNLNETLSNAYEEYRNVKVIDYDQMPSGQTRNIFFTLQTTPEMLKDTSAVLTVKSIWVPERAFETHQERTIEMEIVTSHDPNKMAVYNTRLNYRTVRGKEMTYKIRFQNNGEGPAKTIQLDTEIPEIYDKSTLKILDTYPKVPICPDGQEVQYSCIDTVYQKDKISFIFKNIYLPGSHQKGVQERDSTKGFVKYALTFGKDFHKIPTHSQTAIIFDKNEPIITNMATTRFKPGFSPGIRTGYTYAFPKKTSEDIKVMEEGITYTVNNAETVEKSTGFFLGATFSPYKSYKKYLQAELYADFQHLTYDRQFVFLNDGANGIRNWVQRTETKDIKQTNIQLIPVSLRYNFNAVFATGVGVQTSFRLTGKTTETLEKRYFLPNSSNPDLLGDENIDLYFYAESTTDSGFAWDDAAPFIDVTAGASRIGPSVGIRYLYPMKQKASILQFYVVWKF